MRLRLGALIALLAVTVAPVRDADGQAAARTPRVGLLRTGSAGAGDSAVDGFRQGLRERGYVDGETVALEYRWAEGKVDRLPALAAELVALEVDVIVTGGELAIGAARRATATIPIVMGASNDPVGAGLVKSLARPGGNVTGMTILSPELSAKRLDLLKQLLPRVSRVAVLYNPAFPGSRLDLEQTQAAGRALRLTLQPVEVRTAEAVTQAFADRVLDQADALLPLADPFFTFLREPLVELAARHRRPAMYYWREFVEAGGLASYGPSLPDLYRRAAGHVDKILKGASPADLPIEQPTKFELAVNLKTARALGLAVPRSVLVRADHVIE
ncbi:MAG: ABC transporter substrate-binding protein [Candidatus Rokuibacteriota bacterium]